MTMRFSVKVGELEFTVIKDLNPSDCYSTVFDVAAAELRAVIASVDHSGFEVVDDATADSLGNVPVSGHLPVDLPTSNGRVSADRIDYAFGCGQACSRLLEGQRPDFPRDVRSPQSHFYVLIRDKDGARPDAGHRVFTTWSCVQPLAQVIHEASGARTLGPLAIFKGLASRSEVDSFVRGFQQRQSIFLNPALRSDDPS